LGKFKFVTGQLGDTGLVIESPIRAPQVTPSFFVFSMVR